MAILRCTKKLLNELKTKPSEGTTSSFTKKPQFENLIEVFGQNLFKNLIFENFPQNQIESVLDEHREIIIAKTNNRSVLGSMTDLSFQLKYRIAAMGGLVNIDLTELNHHRGRCLLNTLILILA